MISERIDKKLHICIKGLIIFLLIFIPFRNVLELLFGMYVKMIPDIAIAFLILVFLINRKGKILIQIQDIIIMVFWIIAFINTVIVKKFDIMVFIFEVKSVMLYYMFYFVVRNYDFTEKYKYNITKILRYITYVLFAFAVIEKIFQKEILFPKTIAESIIYADNYARVYSLFFNPNTYGAFLVISFFVVCYFSEERKSLFIYKIIAITSILFSMSRSSILIFILGIGAYLLVFSRKNKTFLKDIVQTIFVVIISISLNSICESIILYFNEQNIKEESIVEPTVEDNVTLNDRMQELSSDEIIEASNADGRLFVLKNGIEIFKDYPILGTGIGTYGSAASMNWNPPLYEKYNLPYGFYADNEYIKDLVESGIVGCLIFGIFLGVILWKNKKEYFNLLLCIIVGWYGLFFNVFEVQIISYLLWVILGVNFEVRKMKE